MKRAGWIFLAALAAGCADGGAGGATTVFDVRPLGARDDAVVFSRGSNQPVVVIGGDPVATAAQLRVPQRLGGGGFQAAAVGTTASRLVFAFSAQSAEALCRGGGAGSSVGTGEASTAWCLQGRPIAYARGRGAALSSPDAPGFERAASRMTNAMLAPIRRRRDQ